MQNREETISHLKERGYVAIARDWAVGESIAVAKRLVDVQPGGIQAFEPTVVWIYPSRDGRWIISCSPGPEIIYHDLDGAVAGALKIVDGWETAKSLDAKDGRTSGRCIRFSRGREHSYKSAGNSGRGE